MVVWKLGTQTSRNHNIAGMLITSLQAERSNTVNPRLSDQAAQLEPKSEKLITLFFFFIFFIFLFPMTIFPIHFLYCCRFSTMITLLVKPRLSFPSPIKKEQTESLYSFLKICCCTYELQLSGTQKQCFSGGNTNLSISVLFRLLLILFLHSG